jgi:CRISPR-associated RAMP protein (TIGR02581 family)
MMIKKIISGNLRALTGIHIGSGDSIKVTDQPLFKNGSNEIIIPGTAIAGALRALSTKIAPHMGWPECSAISDSMSHGICNCPVCELFGSIVIAGDSEESLPSKIWIYDATLTQDVNLSIRDGVGIDRETGASAYRAKFDIEVVPRASEFAFRIELQDDVTDIHENILACALSEWTHKRCYLGGSVSRGLGNMQLEDCKVYVLDLSSTDNLMDYLSSDSLTRGEDEEENWLDAHVENAREITKQTNNNFFYSSFVDMELTLRFPGAFAINDMLNATRIGFDFCPLVEEGAFILPGSSLRGALRSHAEKIARSLTTLDCIDENDFLTKCPACNPHASDIDMPLTSCHALIREHGRKQHDSPEVAAAYEHSCLACQLFGNLYKGSRLYVGDGYMASLPEIKIMDFLAIDRFTGGGKDGAKFDAVVLWKPQFTFRIFLENPEEWELGWLMLVLKDMREGLVTLGFGQNKWFGNVEIKNGNIKLGKIPDSYDRKNLRNNEFLEGIFKIERLEVRELDSYEELIDLWISEFHDRLQHTKRHKDFAPSSDTYFNKKIRDLYPKEVRI